MRYVVGINIHEVKRIEVDEIRDIKETDAKSRHIKIYTECGDMIEFTLFAKDRKSLLIQGVDAK